MKFGIQGLTRRTLLLVVVVISACGGGTEPIASLPTPVKKTATVSGASGIAVHMYQALYGMAPSNAMLIAYSAQATTDLSSFAQTLASNFSNTSHAVLAKQVLDNLGVMATTVPAINATGQSEYALLLDAVTQIFTAFPTMRGQVILNMTNLLEGLESDLTYGAAAVAYNKQAAANFAYSSDSLNSGPQAVNASGYVPPVRGWTYTDDDVNLGIAGVSPGSILLPNGDVRLYVTSTNGLGVYRSSDGLHFTKESTLFISGTDYTVIRRADGMYYAYFRQSTGGVNGVYVRTSSDGLNWSAATPTGISGPYISVPSAKVLQDGRVRLVYPDSVGGGPRDPGIKSAISTDGITFEVEPGTRLAQGANGNQQGPSNPFFADPEMVLTSNGDWLILLAVPPESGHATIYYATSSDGLTWTPNTTTPLIDNGTGTSAFDPTAVPLGDGSYRIYYAADVASSPGQYFMRSGVIRPK